MEKPPSTALNDHIHDVWIRHPELIVPASRAQWLRRREEVLQFIRQQTLGWFPQGDIPFRTRRRNVSGGYIVSLADFGAYEFDSEASVRVRVELLTPRSQPGPLPLIIWIKGPAEHVAFPDLDEFLPCLQTHAVAVLTPRFADRPLVGSRYAGVERTAALTGRSIAALQIWDVLRTVAWVAQDRRITSSEIAVFGRGPAGITGLYAALINPAIGQVIMRDPPSSHLEGPALPMILRMTDIDEVAAALAPRRLALLSSRQDGFKTAHAIYELMGDVSAFRRVESLDAALNDGAGESGRCR